MKYIDAEKLKAEIERLEVLYDEALKNPSFPNDEAYLIAKGKHRQREDILRLIDSLQQEQPAVDLDKEVQRWKNKHGVVGMDDLWLEFARHFYERGINTRKEE